jgi:hypothetical protein
LEEDIHITINKDLEQTTAQDLHFKTETVLVLQGGGSLGTYECGVYNTCIKMVLNLMC